MSESSDNNLWSFLEAVARRRGMIIAIVIAVTILSAVVSLVLPKWYRAEALLLPPKDITVPVGGLSQLAEVVSVVEGLNLPVMVTASDVYARILRSRTIADSVMIAYELDSRYETTTRLETYLALMSHSRFQVTDEGLLSISIEDKDPQTAADLTNAFVDGLDRLNRRIATQRATQNRSFIEERVRQVEAQLEMARQEFEAFQLESRAVDFDEQTRLAIEQAISLKVMLAQIEIDLRMSEQVMGRDNPELVEKRQRRDIIRQQLQQLETTNQDSSFFSLPLEAVPKLRGRYETLYSRVQVNERLYTILLEQLERAKLQENEELPTISILDSATPPEIRSRPQRTLIVAASFGGSLILAVLLALILDYFDRLRQRRPDDYDRAMYVIRAFFGWLPGMKNVGKR